MKILSTLDPGFAKEFLGVVDRWSDAEAEVNSAVAEMVRRVRHEGDAAVLEYAKRFDGVDAIREVPAEAFRDAAERIGPDLKKALALCLERVRDQAEKELPRRIPEAADEIGVTLGRRFLPMRRAGIYVPGGRAAYPSSLIMAGAPARTAGVGELIVVTPLDPESEQATTVLAAAHLLDVDRMFIVGGAHAVAALAFGTLTIPRVDIIVGPGNAYVAEAKRQLYGHVAVDGVAGPSEVVIMADDALPVEWAAADLLAQAEHDPLARCVLLTTDADYAKRVVDETARQAKAAIRRTVVEASLSRFGVVIVTRDWDEAAAVADTYAPEHLQIVCAEGERLLAKVRNAGAVFMGAHTPEALGDYLAGSNHVLPTAGTARYCSGLSAATFMRATNIVRATPAGLQTLAADTMLLAESEGLYAHSDAVRRRVEGGEGGKDA